MDKQKVVYLYNRLFSNEVEWSTATCSNTNEPQQHYVMWKKSVTNDHTLYDSVYMKYPNR